MEFYSHTKNEKADLKNCVFFGDAQADRYPCGTGTSAKLAALYAKGELKLKLPEAHILQESMSGYLMMMIHWSMVFCLITEIVIWKGKNDYG